MFRGLSCINRELREESPFDISYKLSCSVIISDLYCEKYCRSGLVLCNLSADASAFCGCVGLLMFLDGDTFSQGIHV